MEKSSIIALPEIDELEDKDYENETTINNLRNLLIDKAIKVVNNTILKDYISKEDIKRNIERYAKDIVVYKGAYVGDPIYTWNTLKLNPCFFTSPIQTAHYQNNELHKYPELLKLIEIIGLTTAVSDTVEDWGFRLGTNNTKNVFIKSLIANYFATTSEKQTKKEINFSGIEFTSFATSNCLQVNMIHVLAKIIGEDILAEALVSQETEKTLMEAIDNATGKKDLGKEFLNQLRELNNASKNQMTAEAVLNSDITFYQEKMKPFIEMLKQQNPKMQTFITTFLEEYNFDLEDYQFHHGNLKELDITFTKEDIDNIKYYCERFSKQVDDANNNGYSIIDYLYVSTPEIRPRDNTYHSEDFTFVNKVMTIILIDENYYNQSLNRLANRTNSIVNLLSEEIIPRTMKKQGLNLNPEELEETLSLLTFKNKNVGKSKKGQRKIEKVKKQIIKKQKSTN